MKLFRHLDLQIIISSFKVSFWGGIMVGTANQANQSHPHASPSGFNCSGGDKTGSIGRESPWKSRATKMCSNAAPITLGSWKIRDWQSKMMQDVSKHCNNMIPFTFTNIYDTYWYLWSTLLVKGRHRQKRGVKKNPVLQICPWPSHLLFPGQNNNIAWHNWRLHLFSWKTSLHHRF